MPKQFKIVPLDQKHLSTVHRINEGAFTSAWSREDFEQVLHQKGTIGLVSLDGDRVAGYMIYERHKHVLFLLNMACANDYARMGVVSGLVEYVKSRLKRGRQERIETDVPEVAEACIGMLRKAGFRATGVNRDQFEQAAESVIDGYTFMYSLPRETFRNRLAKAFLQQRKQ